VLVDIDPKTLNTDPEAMAAGITGRTKAVVPVHVSGRSANMPIIMDIAREHGLFVIEDAAEAFMSAVDGKCLGTFGQAGCLSFSPNKTVTTGQGGMILTNDDALHHRLRELKDHGRPVRGTGGDDIHHSVGYNFKLTNLQAAVGLGQLSALRDRLERQKRIYQLYSENLNGLDGIRVLGFEIERGEIPQWTDALVERRDDLDTYLQVRGVHCRRFWYPIHTQAPYRLPDDDFPNSTRVIPHALWLPSGFTLSDEDVLTVCRHVQEFLSR
jgi:perosamine synthetase